MGNPDRKMTLDEIAEKHGAFVSSLCRRIILDEEMARDAAQHAWVEIVKSYPSFRGESKLTTWMYSIVRRVVMDYAVRERTYSTRHLREYFRADEEPVPARGKDMEQEVWVRQMCDRCLTGILHCLDAEARLAYVLKDIAKLTYAEMEAVFGRDQATLRQSVTRSRKKLRAFLGDECYLYNPEGSCKCRMKPYVREVNLRAEYGKLRNASNLAEFFGKSGEMLPEKNFWKKVAV
jgi:RNA polymerase sigma-70 factor (ECF subfamily)